MRLKTAPAKVKLFGQADDTPDGQFSALVSVFGTVDSVGDVVMPGAFSKSLARYVEKGAQIPIVWSHDWDDPFSHIGYAMEASETANGLEVKARLDLDNPKAKQVYRLLKGGRVRDFSFAYDVIEASAGERDGKSVMELRELDIFECGPTLIGAHRDTELLEIKTGQNAGRHVLPPPDRHTDVGPVTHDAPDAETKQGRVLSAKNESRIAQIAQLAHELLDSVRTESSTQDEGKATPPPPAADEDRNGKSDAPATDGTASTRLRGDLELFLMEGELAVNTSE